MLRSLAARLRGTVPSIAPFDRSVEKRLDLGEALGDKAPSSRSCGATSERRVNQKTAPPFRIVHRMLDDLLEETANRLFWRQRLFQTLDQRPRRVIEIVFQRSRIQRMLIAVSVVEARRRDPHFIGKIPHRRRLIAALPETLHCRLERGRFVKFPWPRHSFLPPAVRPCPVIELGLTIDIMYRVIQNVQSWRRPA